jgi:hypothetical protein
MCQPSARRRTRPAGVIRDGAGRRARLVIRDGAGRRARLGPFGASILMTTSSTSSRAVPIHMNLHHHLDVRSWLVATDVPGGLKSQCGGASCPIRSKSATWLRATPTRVRQCTSTSSIASEIGWVDFGAAWIRVVRPVTARNLDTTASGVGSQNPIHRRGE